MREPEALALLEVTAILITREATYPEDARPRARFGEVIVETSCPGVHRRWVRRVACASGCYRFIAQSAPPDTSTGAAIAQPGPSQYPCAGAIESSVRAKTSQITRVA